MNPTEDTTEQAAEAKQEAEDRFQAMQRGLGDGEEATGGAFINGVSVAEMQEAFERLPSLERWAETSHDLLSDIYGLAERAQAANLKLAAENRELRGRLAELDPSEGNAE